MVDPIRQEVVALAQLVVIKIGTNVLTDNQGALDRGRVQELADQVQRLQATSRKVVLVSSGAIGAGVGLLNLGKRPNELRHLQACAAIGQSVLMQAYQEALGPHGVHPAQILLTAGDFENRARYLNVRNTILTLLEWNCLPIINENDTVSVAEIRFGDNDHLAAMVTNLLQAPLLILLTNVDGLYSADPSINPAAELLATVPLIDGEVTELAGIGKSALGTGGMASKLKAARLATASGESVIMANGAQPRILDRLFQAEPLGTLFLPHGGVLSARKRWIGTTVRPRGKIVTDEGARNAVLNKGKSLLPIGVIQICGQFGKGDIVSLTDAQGQEYARGLCNYGSADAERIRGLRTEQIATALGDLLYVELVHRDNLALLE